MNFQWLNSQLDMNSVGGKAYNLSLLNKIGVNVPKGIVIPNEVFELYKQNKIELSTIMTSIPKLNSPFLMVRSSAIGEDGEDQSFAGQLESFQVQNDLKAIEVAVKNCWDSMRNSRVETYQESNNIQLEKMGVIIQEMIEPDYAGVYFTNAPDHEKESLIEYVEGHCEKLVQGEVTPISKYGDEDFNFPFSINEFKKESSKIKSYFNQPQDIEWLVKNDEFFFVQTRPITSLKRRINWSSTNVNENYPNKLSPLLYSIARRSYYFYFKNLALKLGLKLNTDSEAKFYNIIGVWGERMYYNMDNIHSLFELTPFKNMLANSFDNFVGYQKKSSLSAQTKLFLAKILFVSRCLKHFRNLEKYVEKIEARVNEFCSKSINLKNMKKLYHDFLEIRFNYWFHASFADFFAMLTHGALGKFVNALKLDQANGIHNSLIQSIPGLVSNEPIFALWELKELIRKENKTLFFLDNSNEKILMALENDQEFILISKLIDKYLKNWGFRCTGELTFFDDNYIENPASFIQMLKMYLKSENENPKNQFAKKHKEQELKLDEVSQKVFQKNNFLKAIVLNFVLNFLVKSTMKSISARERVRLKQAQMYFKFKEVCLFLGQELTQKNNLKSKYDIFFLEFDEISRILNGEEIDYKFINDLITLRKEKIERANEKPENIYNFENDFNSNFVDKDITLNDNDLKGLPACGGVVKARAVVLDSIHDIHKLKKGDILITKQTDPGWICAFPLISGLVVERGGMLSHGAIVAREFGIPAVVGIKNITKKIKTNDLIEVDGNNGVINV